MAFSTEAILLLFAVSSVSAQFGPGNRYGPWGDFDSNGDDDNNFGPFGITRDTSTRRTILIAHGVLAALAFVIFFPVGAILIRLGSFRGAWLVHGLFQLFAYIVYTIAFGIGVWMVNVFPVNLLGTYHPVIGVIVFVLLFFQPILGYIHHRQYKKYSRRTVWSYGHLWLGRIAITLGMINGGLGMLLAKEAPPFLDFRPNQGQITAYGVVAGIMWLLWMISIFVGERRRKMAKEISAEVDDGLPPPYKENYAPDSYR